MVDLLAAKPCRPLARWPFFIIFTRFHDEEEIPVNLGCRQADAVVNSGLLLMAVMGLLIPAALHYTHSEAQFGKSELALSRFSSCIMLVAYASYLYFQLSNNRRRNEANVVSLMIWWVTIYDYRYCNCVRFLALLFVSFLCNFLKYPCMPLIKRRIQDDVDGNDDEVPEISKREAISWIAIFIAWISMLSYYLVDAIDVIALLHPSFTLFWCLLFLSAV